MPLNQITMEEFSCAMVDSCPPYFSENELYEMFMENFRRHYETNKAPLGLYFHTLWFKEAKNRKAFRKFLDEMVKRQDVWIVSNWEVWLFRNWIMFSILKHYKKPSFLIWNLWWYKGIHILVLGYSMDAATHSSISDGYLPSLENLWWTNSSREPGMQHSQVWITFEFFVSSIYIPPWWVKFPITQGVISNGCTEQIK